MSPSLMTKVLKRAGAILGAVVLLLLLLAPQLVGVIFIAGGVIGGGVGVAVRVAVSSDRVGPLPYLTAAVGAVLAGAGGA